jgi:hypothetical protein
MTKDEALEVKFYFEEITEVEAVLDMISNDKTVSLENIATRLAILARARFSRPHLQERTLKIVEQCVDLIDKELQKLLFDMEDTLKNKY